MSFVRSSFCWVRSSELQIPAALGGLSCIILCDHGMHQRCHEKCRRRCSLRDCSITLRNASLGSHGNEQSLSVAVDLLTLLN